MNLEDMGKYKDPSVLILLSLLGGNKHGYAIMEDIRSSFEVDLGPGTLYGAIARLEKQRLIEPLPANDRRVPYTITGEGVQIIQSQMESMKNVIAYGSRRLGLL
ncbi:MAG: PadR family transcriptional regulator [Gorillibacterium sp.]|nr:PadR family transcriptional regulator [Gorillibacterium sp.]